MAQIAPDDTLSLLSRLASKPGVQSTLILSRQTGAIVRSSGFVTQNGNGNNGGLEKSASNADGTSTPVPAGKEIEGILSAETVARQVWDFVRAAGTMVEALEGGPEEDGLRLLRVRTRKYELVIVPDAKFILVAVHTMGIT